MSSIDAAQVIGEFFNTHDTVFTTEEFCKYLKSKGVKITKSQADDLLRSSDVIFSLVNNEFITRSGVFSGRWFSFKPTKEEVDKGAFLLGHRCMPFVNPQVAPDSIVLMNKKGTITSTETVFSLNLAFDVFALFGEGYVIPYVFNDKANVSIPLASVQYNLPKEINLTSWSLKDLCDKEEFEFGDRILCRVIDWSECVVEVQVQKANKQKLMVSSEAIEREQWYSDFENGLLESFDKNGPGESIEEQLAFLFLENQEILCVKNCGSCEEFLKHTKKIGFSFFGVESRIWRNGESVPYVGPWNKNYEKDLILSEMAMSFTPQVIDAYLEDRIYNSFKKSKAGSKTNQESMEDLSKKIFPQSLIMTPEERKVILLNIEKRHAILEKHYNKFLDHNIAEIRKRILSLFSEVCKLLCDIGASGIKVEEFPQQELVVLSQLYAHLVRLLEEVENVVLRERFPIDDVALSLEGMEDTFEGICGILKSSLERNRRKGFGIISSD